LTKVLIIIGLLLLTFLLLIYKKLGKKVFLVVLAILLISSAVVSITASLTAKHWVAPLARDLHWAPLDVEFIQQQVAEGKTVFVDVTADWCVTCKANKMAVIHQDPVYSALKDENIVLVKGDWTVPSEKITDYLRRYDRFGVPFNIVYGPSAPNGIELSTILSKDAVLNALKKAK
jgi:suppressor for copper-sensitivity B